jgi:hypothetical protein
MAQPTPPSNPGTDFDAEPYFDRSFDMVARVRAAKEAAQRKIEEFGDVSEYEITTVQGQKKQTDQSADQEASAPRQLELNVQDSRTMPRDEVS